MKTAIVTGASSGIGAEFVKQLSSDPSIEEIWLIARTKKQLEKVSQTVQQKTRLFPLDLEKLESIKELQKTIQTSKPNLTTLVNAAGFGKNGEFHEIDRDEQLAMVDLNCRAIVGLTHIALPYMQKGAIVYNISSISGFAPLGAFAVYGASKAFVTSFSIALRAELHSKGIKVLTVAPGSVSTNFQKRSRGKSKREKKMFAHKSTAEEVVTQAINDAKRNKVFSLFGATAKFARILRRILPHKYVAHLSHTKIYPKK